MGLNRKNRVSREQVAQMHHNNLRQNLQRRLEAARAKGDEALIRQLEAEADYIG
ncbi:arginine synthesis PII-interacting regulator PirA [Thermoleptolyngbya sp.]